MFGDASQTVLYQKDQEIVEVAREVAIRHVPVIVNGEYKLITQVHKSMESYAVKDGSLHYQGLVSHPRSLIHARATYLDENANPTEKTYEFITDALGEFGTYLNAAPDSPLAKHNPIIPQSISENGKALILSSVAISYELNPFYKGQNIADVQTEKTSVASELKPIPSYLEGIAYDENGAPIPNAIVAIFASEPDFMPMYTTIADGSGKFSVGSQHLPEDTYTIKYKKPDGAILVIEPALFLRQNLAYFSKSRVAPFATKVSSQTEDSLNDVKLARMIKQTDIQALTNANTKTAQGVSLKTGGGMYFGKKDQTSTPTTSSPPMKNGQAIIVVVVILSVLIGAAIIVALQLKKKTPTF